MSETSFCQSCKRHVSAASFIPHTAHCERFMEMCIKCNEPIPKAQMEQHNLDVHTLVPCKDCKTQLEKREQNDHIKNDCPKRLLPCEYCEIDVQAANLENHEHMCGSRTDVCEICGNNILVRMLKEHMKLHNNLPSSSSVVPQQIAAKNKDLVSQLNQLNGLNSPEELPKFRNVICKNIFQAATLEPEIKEVTENRKVVQKDEDDLQIPCEFCSTLCTLDTLEEHQLFCNSKVDTCPDCGSYVFGQLSTHTCAQKGEPKITDGQDENYWSQYETATSHQPEDEIDEPTVPCDTCGILFPISCLQLHEIGCKFSEESTGVQFKQKITETRIVEQAPEISKIAEDDSDYWSGYNCSGTNNDNEEEPSIPCEMCGNLFPFSCVRLHEIACSTQKEDSNRQQYGYSHQPFEKEDHALEAQNFEGLADEDENVFAPCEFCKESFPISQLKIHELGCKFPELTKLEDIAEPFRPIVTPADRYQGAPLDMPAFLPCTFCNIVISSNIFEMHEARCSSRFFEEKPNPTKEATSKKPVVVNTRPENEKQREVRESSLLATENRLLTAPKIRPSQYAVVQLPDGREVLKKRNPSGNNVDAGHVLGHGQKYESKQNDSFFNQMSNPFYSLKMNRDIDRKSNGGLNGTKDFSSYDSQRRTVQKKYDHFVSGNEEKSNFSAKETSSLRKNEESRVVKKPHSSFVNYAHQPDPGHKLGSGSNHQNSRSHTNRPLPNGAIPRSSAELSNRTTNILSPHQEHQHDARDRKREDSLGARPKRP